MTDDAQHFAAHRLLEADCGGGDSARFNLVTLCFFQMGQFQLTEQTFGLLGRRGFGG